VTLYATLCGHMPFEAGTLEAKLRAIREDDPPLPRALRPGLARELQAICLKAMERSPADRYASAEELARDLERFLKGDPVQALPVRSAAMLRRKLELQLVELAEWERLGLVDEGQRLGLAHAYEKLDEQRRGLLRGTFTSVPNVLLLIGIVLCVFGPLILQVATWDEQGPAIRLLLPGLPLALLAAVGGQRWRAADRRRGLACLFGAALLVAPCAFALADLAPALSAVSDDTGALQPVRPGEMWLPPSDSPSWLLAGARRLEWKLVLTAALTLAAALALYRGTRSASFLWIACLSSMGAVVCLAALAGWHDWPSGLRWLLSMVGSLATIAVGAGFERSFRRERAWPFYGLGFCALVMSSIVYAERGLPLSLLGVPDTPDRAGWSHLIHGLLFTAAGVLADRRGTQLLRQLVGAPLFVGLVTTLVALASLVGSGGTVFEILLVAGCVAYLLLGLALHRHALVFPASIALPLAVGAVSQRHIAGLWAWSAAVVIGGATLVLTSFRLGAARRPPAR
jgi:hypothetical protein